MNLRIFHVGDKKAVFNKEAFRHLLKEKCIRSKKTISLLEKELANHLGISENTVHKWYYGTGGPIDFETVKRLAETLDVKDITLLLKFIDEGDDTMEKLSDRQLSAVKRVYDACVQFLHEFERTAGFNDYWFDLKDAGSTDIETELADMADDKINYIRLVLRQEYFDLHDCEIYNTLWEYVNEDLMNTYDGKLSYGYRFEALVEGNPTTDEDYDKAMIRLNTIISKYT